MSWKSSCIALVTEVRTAHGLVALQLGALAFDRDTADLENIGVGGQLERNPRILLDQQDRDLVLAIDRPDDLEDRANDDRRQAEGRFVEEHQARLHEQRAGEREHLLLTARQSARRQAPLFLEHGEVGEDAVVVLAQVSIVVAPVRAELEVFVDGQLGADPTALGNVGDAPAHDLFGGHAMQRTAVKLDVPGPMNAAGDRAQRCGLARSVRAQQRYRAALGHLQGYAVEDGRRAVPRVHPFQLEEGAPAAPRWAAITAGLRGTSAGAPSAIFRPKSRTTTRSEIPITKVMWCSTSSIVTPSSVCTRRRSFEIESTSSWLIPPAGSSSRTSLGRQTRARASSTRF